MPCYEDFRPPSYTEVDPNNRLSQTITRSTFAGLSRAEDTYLYDDKGVGHFNGDFDHKFDFRITVGVQFSYVVLWCLMNTIDDYSGRGNDHISFYIHHGAGASLDFVLRATFAGGVEQVHTSAGAGNEGVTYYIRVKRVGTVTTLKVYLLASDRDSEINSVLTLSVNPAGVSSLQYIYPTQSVNIGGAQAISGYVENLDLMEIVVPTVVTNAATCVSDILATLNGDITATGGSTVTSRGFEWGIVSGVYPDNWNEAGSFGTGAFTHNITIICNVTYFYRAFATNCRGTGYGLEVTFACEILESPDDVIIEEINRPYGEIEEINRPYGEIEEINRPHGKIEKL